MGYDPAEEYALMAQGGMNFPAVLASLTSAPAEQFGESNRLGQIAEGFEADLTVVRGDPAADIRALVNVRHTLRAGLVVYGN